MAKKTPFIPLHVRGKNGAATPEDLNRVQDQVRAAFKKIQQGGVTQVTSRDSSVRVTPKTGVGSVDLAMQWQTQPSGGQTLNLGAAAPAVTSLDPASWVEIKIGNDYYVLPAWKLLSNGGSDPPSLGLTHWYKGDAGVTESGGSVSSWADQVGSDDLVQATAGQQPAYNGTGISGVPAIQFSTADTVLLEASGLVTGSEFSISVVFSYLGTSAGRLVDWFYPTHNKYIWVRPGTPYFQDDGAGGVSAGGSTSLVGGATQKVLVTVGAGTLSFFQSSLATADQTASLTTGGATGLRLGALGSFGQASNSMVAEMLIWDHALDPSERSQLDTYYTDRGY